MDKKNLKIIIDTANSISNKIISEIDTLSGDELSTLHVKLAGYYNAICGFHEDIKSDYISVWNALRPVKKSDKATDFYLLQHNKSAQLYDRLKYTLKGLDEVLDAVKTRLYHLSAQAKNQM